MKRKSMAGPPGLDHAGQLSHGLVDSPKISAAVDPIALVTTECISITSAMRKHARWAHSSVLAILGGGVSSVNGLDSPPSPSPREILAFRKEQGPQESTAVGREAALGTGLANRWGLRGKRGKSIQDNPLISAFALLRGELARCSDITKFDTPALLHPFLQVIRSPSTSAPITSLALMAITKFFAYNIINPESPRLSLAMQTLSSAITHCRFEASDSAADEVVLLRILRLMECMIGGDPGHTLGDDSMREMMETGLSMCCQVRLSELLRRSAEMAVTSMCQVIFERLKHLEADDAHNPEDQPRSTFSPITVHPSDGQDSRSYPQEPQTEPRLSKSSQDQLQEPRESDESKSRKLNGIPAARLPSSEGRSEAEIKPYSLPSVEGLFAVLVDLLNPHDRQHTDSLRIMALQIINVAIEVAGSAIVKHAALSNLARDKLCLHLFQLVRSDNTGVLQGALRLAGTLLATCRRVLKLQQELFLSYLIACLYVPVEIPPEPGIDPALYDGIPQAPKLLKPRPSQPGSGRSTPVPVKDRQKLGMEGGSRKPDAMEAIVESIGALARIPTFVLELFVNYDCDVDRSDLCVDMVGLLSRNAFPDSATWSTTNVPPLCLDALLGYVQFIANRLDDEPKTAGYPDPSTLRKQRTLKRVIVEGAAKFNEDPKSGIVYLAQHGIIEDPDDPHSVAGFLKGTSRISKRVLGDYLSKKSNEHILRAFFDQFNFGGKRVDEALRESLETFRLPGEAPLIARIVTTFSEKYCASSTTEDIPDKDAIYVLTYAIIMLNTDQHNPNVKDDKRMSEADFARNLRGVNGGQDFAPEYLREIYESIKNREIILPDEHDNQQAFDYAWKELLVKARSATDMCLCDTNIFDADMFAATWKPVVATLSYVFMSASDDAVFSRVVTGFDQCARVAAKYNLHECFDHIVFVLSSLSTLASESPPNTTLNTEVQVNDHSVMVSELAVKFGRDFKAQLATVVLFRVLTGHESTVRMGWKHIVRIWLNLFANSLIPPSFAPDRSSLDIPPIPLQSPSQFVDRGQKANESGLLSAFTSYISSYAADDPPEPSDDELESTLCTVDCISACFLGDAFTNVMDTPVEPVKFLVESLLAQLPQKNSPVVIAVKPDAPLRVSANGQRHVARGVVYDPIVVYVLELATVLAIRDQGTIEAVGEDVAEALLSVIRDAANIHSTAVARAVYYLLCLVEASQEYSFLRAPVVLHAISSMEASVLENSATYIIKGISRCIRNPGPLRNEMVNSPDFWVILKALQPISDIAGSVFGILENVADDNISAITADNYEAVISLLNDFISSGSIGSAFEQKQDLLIKRGKHPKQAKAQDNEVVKRAIKAIRLIDRISGRVHGLIQQSQLEHDEAWAAYWSPIFRALAGQCLNPCREIRHHALSSLQRSLLSPQVTSTEHKQWTAIFGEVLFPLIIRLLKPEVYQADPVWMSETRVQAATLLCKVFLHYLVMLSEWDGMLDLWLKILDIMDRLMHSGQGDNLEEAVPESLKNIILVMSAGGYLVPPDQNPEKETLWKETWKRLDRFLPDLFSEVYPQRERGSSTSDIPAGAEGNHSPAASS